MDRSEVMALVRGELSRLETLVRQLQGALGGRVVWGAVDSAGVPSRGSGFSAVKNATGEYSVTYDRSFSANPSVVVDTEAVTEHRVSVNTTTGFTVRCANSSGVLADTGFYFISIGPA